MSKNDDVSAKSPRHRHAWQLALLAFSQFIIAVDYNIVYVALPDIGTALHFSAQSLQWVVSAYAVGFGGFLLFGGRAADKLGHRRMFILGLAIFGASSLVGGLTNSAGLLIAARTLQGLGGALLMPATLSLINVTFKEGSARNRALAIWGAAGSGGLAAGAVMGGVLTNWLGWEWVLFVMVPLALGAAVAARRLLAADPPFERGAKGFDVAGALLATASSMLLVFALVQGPETGWLAMPTLIAFGTGALLLAGLVAVERRSRHPLIPLEVLRNKSLLTAMLVILVFQATLGGAYYLFTTYVQGVLHYNALQAGLAFLPLTIISMLSSLKMTPLLLGRWGIRHTLLAGMVVNGIGLTLLTLGMSIGGSLWTVLPGLIVWGIGAGTTFPAMFIAAAAGVKPSEQGIASALASTSQQIGGAIGLAVLIAIATAPLAAGGMASAATTLVAGTHAAGLTAGLATIAGGFLALVIKPAPAEAPQQTDA